MKKLNFVLVLLSLVIFGLFVYTLWFIPLTQSTNYFNQKILVTGFVVTLYLILFILRGIYIKKMRKIGIFFISILLILVNSTIAYGSFYINSINGTFNNLGITKYHGVVVTLATSQLNNVDDLTLHTVGLYQSQDELLLNIIPKEEINRQVEYVTYSELYSSSYELVAALNSGEVDAIVLPYNYENQLSDNASFNKQAYKVIFEYNVNKPSNLEVKEVNQDEAFNLLLLGSDGGRTDTILIATISPKTASIILTTVPRDSLLESTCLNNTYDKINHSGAEGGFTCLKSVLETTFNTSIDYYMEIDFNGIIDIVDYLGGIWIDNPYSDFGMNGFMGQDENRIEDSVFIPLGLNLLNGQQALSFARDRYHSDAIQRSSNNITVVKAMLSAMLSEISFTDIPQFLSIVQENIVGTNFPLNDLDSMTNLASKFYTTSPAMSGFTLDGYASNYYSVYAGQTLSGVYPYTECQIAITDLINKSMSSTTIVNTYSFNLLDEQKITLVTEDTNYYDVTNTNGGPY